MSEKMATTEDFEKLDIRVGQVVDVQPFAEGRYSTHILIVSRQSKGASDRRFKRGQLDAEGMSDFAGGFSPETLRKCTRGKSSGYG